MVAPRCANTVATRCSGTFTSGITTQSGATGYLSVDSLHWCKHGDVRSGAPTMHPKSAINETDRHLEYIDRQPTASGLLVFILHVAPGIAHGFDYLIQRNEMLAATP